MGNARRRLGMLECERLFGELRGREVQDLVEAATGELCPCKRDMVCPLLVLGPALLPQAV
jgi:hypothetical protein